jgi:N-acetyl-gamma-glutamylphosphate reductase
MNKQIPAIVLGGTGYVSGELLRLLLGHPNFALAGVMSDSAPGELAGNPSRIWRACWARRHSSPKRTSPR